MDFAAIRQIMESHGLARNPAFDKTRFLVENIPCESRGCPLGLYYPDSDTIVIPNDGAEGTLVHELGHRFGDYYFNDLSETYAENFRKHYTVPSVPFKIGMMAERRAVACMCDNINREARMALPTNKIDAIVTSRCGACPEKRNNPTVCDFCDFGNHPLNKAPYTGEVLSRRNIKNPKPQSEELPIPVTAQLVFNHEYPNNNTYTGDRQRCVAKATINLPDQLFSGVWEAQQLVNTYYDQIVAQGSVPLSIEVYEDRMSGTFSTDFYLVCIAEIGSSVPSGAVPFVIAIAWSTVMLALIILAIVVVAAWLIVQVINFVVTPAGQAISWGLILIGVGAVALVGAAIIKGTSVKESIIGPQRSTG